jgi:hypothetical protein
MNIVPFTGATHEEGIPAKTWGIVGVIDFKFVGSIESDKGRIASIRSVRKKARFRALVTLSYESAPLDKNPQKEYWT